MEQCAACGFVLQTVEYQSRSADEAHTVVTSCSNCPINPNKLNSETMPGTSFRGIGKAVLRPKHMRVVSGGMKSGELDVLRADLRSGHKYNKIALDIPHVTTSDEVTVSNNQGVSVRAIALYSITGFLPLTSARLKRSVCLGAGVFLDSYDTFVHRPVHSTLVRTSHGSMAVVEQLFGCNSYVYLGNEQKKRQLIIVLARHSSSELSLPNVIESLYCENFLPLDIYPYIQKDDVLRLSNLSARGWDATCAPETGHMFTSKPDGERCWLTMYGNMWYVTERWYKGNAKHWIYEPRYDIGSKGPIVLDVEYIQRYGYVLIDILRDDTGVFAPISRDIHWVLSKYKQMKLYETKVNLAIRDYFADYELAVLYSNAVPYPTDGVVAIRNGSTEILKIKTTKSMELQHRGDGNMYTSDNVYVCNITPYSNIEPDTIVEVRFTIQQGNMEMKIENIFERSDKSKANSANAVQNILISAIRSESTSDNQRRGAYLWCNNLRNEIRKRSQLVNKDKSIVLDVGSGNGQAFDSSLSSEQVSCIYVEPDSKLCASLARRLNIKTVISDPTDIIPFIRPLKTRSLRGVILNCTLDTLCSVVNVMQIIVPELKCVLCTFSMHFVIDALHMISEYGKVPIYGCTYLYDDIDNSGVLVDESGVVMKIDNDLRAVVRWGTDARYTEPVTKRKDYAGLGRIVSGLAVTEFNDMSVLLSASRICSKVYVLLP